MSSTIEIVRTGLVVLALSRCAAAQEVEPPTTVTPRQGCVTAECHPKVKSQPFLHGPLLVNGCDSCHRLADVEKHAYEMQLPADEMCRFCHEFEVPAAHTVVHEPLLGGDCLSCHDPHGGTIPNLLRGESYADSCKSCHGDLTGSKRYVHGPAAGSCGACHEPHASENPLLLSTTGNDLCLRCHVALGARLESVHVVHAPVSDGCKVCHDPHATDNEALLRDDPVSLCTTCHEGIAHTVDTASSTHAAVTKERACLNCHDPHGSDSPGLLNEGARMLCHDCHGEPIEVEGRGQIRDVLAELKGAKIVHEPVARDNCVACHAIHGGGFSRLLMAEYPAMTYFPFDDAMYSLCFTCHDRQLVMQEEATAVTRFRDGKQNLHYVHVHREEKGRTCFICHDSHASMGGHMIRGTFPFGPKRWMLPIGWSELENGGRCDTACHSAWEYDRVNPVKVLERPVEERAEPGKSDGSEKPGGGKKAEGKQGQGKKDGDRKKEKGGGATSSGEKR